MHPLPTSGLRPSPSAPRPRALPTHLGRWLATCALHLGLAAAATSAQAGWTSAPAITAESRAQHTATALATGEVLVAGGETNAGGGGFPVSTRLYTPATNTWRNGPDLPLPRYGHTATRLADGRVLLAGGRHAAPLQVNEAGTLYIPANAPATGTLAPTGPMQLRRSHHTATLLPDNTVLVAGGWGIAGQDGLSNVEIYDPQSNTWDSAAQPLPQGRALHTATLLPGGRVLVVGGRDNGLGTTRTAWIREADGSWTAVPMPAAAPTRAEHTATLLPDGRVLIAGGRQGTFAPYIPLNDTYLFNPADNSWTPGPTLTQARYRASATLMGNGSVLIAGGTTDTESVNTAETLSFAPGGAGQATAQPAMATPRNLHTATLLPTQQVLVLGGRDDSDATTATAELFSLAAPNAPTNVTAQPGNARVTVRWQAPAGGTTPARYTATAQPGGRSCTVSHPATSCTVTGLTNGTPYTFTVVATALGGLASPPSAPPAAATPSAAAGPGGAQPVPTLGEWSLALLAALMLLAGIRLQGPRRR